MGRWLPSGMLSIAVMVAITACWLIDHRYIVFVHNCSDGPLHAVHLEWGESALSLGTLAPGDGARAAPGQATGYLRFEVEGVRHRLPYALRDNHEWTVVIDRTLTARIHSREVAEHQQLLAGPHCPALSSTG